MIQVVLINMFIKQILGDFIGVAILVLSGFSESPQDM